jgi:hypothetical protein
MSGLSVRAGRNRGLVHDRLPSQRRPVPPCAAAASVTENLPPQAVDRQHFGGWELPSGSDVAKTKYSAKIRLRSFGERPSITRR